MTLSDTCYGSTMIWFQLCKWLNEKHDIEVSSRLIPLVDEHTHLLIEAEKNKSNERHENAETCRRLQPLRRCWGLRLFLSPVRFFMLFFFVLNQTDLSVTLYICQLHF